MTDKQELSSSKELSSEAQQLRDALEFMYAKWEDGTPCTDGGEPDGASMGNAFKLNEREEKWILSLIPKFPTNPQPRALETSDDVLRRIHSELARGHSSAALAVVAAAREHRPLPACASCDVVTLSQNAQKASEGRQHIVKQNGAHAVGCPGCQPDYALSEGDQRG